MTYKIYNPDNSPFITGFLTPNGQLLNLHIAPKSFALIEDFGEQVNKTYAHLEVSPASEEDVATIEKSHGQYLANLNKQALSREKYAKEDAVKDAKKALAVQKRVLAEKQAAEKEAQANFKAQLASEKPKEEVKSGKEKKK